MKTYLGDGVYAEIQHGQVVLTTEDGISASNCIYLEPEVYKALTQFVEDARAAVRAASHANTILDILQDAGVKRIKDG